MNTKVFYKMMASFYDLLDVIYFREYEKSPRKVVLEAIDNKDIVLDLCTGTATNAMKIAKTKPQTKVVGIDLSKDMLRVAKSKVRKAKIHNLKLYYMDATRMKFKDQSFDKILISLVLHEMDEDIAGKLLFEAGRVLKKEGEIIVTEWERSKSKIHKLLFFPINVLEPKPFKSFVKKDLYRYFENYGFEVKKEVHCDYSKVLVLSKKN